MRLSGVGILAAFAIAVVAACGSSGTSATAAPVASGTPVAPSSAGPTPAMSSAATQAPATPSTGGGQGVPDAGSLLTADMVAPILGAQATRIGEPAKPGAPMSLVAYMNAAVGSVSASVERVPGRVQEAMALALKGAAMQPLSGIGDVAGTSIQEHEAVVVFAKGDTVVVVIADVAGETGADLGPKVEAIAREIAVKL